MRPGSCARSSSTRSAGAAPTATAATPCTSSSTSRVADAVADPRENEVLRVHESLEELAAIDARLVQVVEMRYFAGMTVSEIAGVLDLAERTVARDWEKARLFLHACAALTARREPPPRR